MKKTVWYFAYGSNMDAERMKDRVKCLPVRVPGVLREWYLEFSKVVQNISKAGFANIVPCQAYVVDGILYKVMEEELQELD